MYEGMFVTESNANQYCCNQQQSKALVTIMNSPRDQTDFPEITNSVKAALFNDLIVYYKLHLAHFNDLKSIAILRQVLI